MNQPHDLPPSIESYVRHAAVRQRRLAFARRLGLSLSVATLIALTACLADRLLRLPGPVRLVLLLSSLATLIFPILSPALALFRRIDYVATAARIETLTTRFSQRLLTLVSQYAAPPSHRGSPEFLSTIRADVESQIPLARPRKLLPWTRAAGPWFLASLAIALPCVAWNAPWLGLPRLTLRFVAPLGSASPVTTTHIAVTPGPARVVQGEPVTIHATISPTDVPDVTLRVGPPNRSTTPMTRSAPGEYTLTIPSVEQPFTYTLFAGDATTDEFPVTVLPHPAVAELRVRFTYPDYARRAPLTVTSRDGVIEAPVGTRATLQVVSTEPLRSGALVFPAGRVELRPTPDPRTFEADVAMTTDQAYQIELLSDQGVPARAATRLLVRPVPDRPPVVRLLQPVDDLRLDPRAVLPVWFDARDDIGVTAATAHVRVNNADQPRDLPIPLPADTRQLDTSYDLDLAPLNLKVGDVVAISVGVSDGLNQSAQSDPRHILITPRTIDIATYQRLSELKSAAHVAASLASSLQNASAASAELTATGPAALAKLSTLNQQLAGAAEAETLLRQSLTGALARSDSPALSTTLANLADALAVCTSTTARVAARVGIRGGAGPDIRDAIDSALAAAKTLQTQLALLSAGQQAAATLADRNNLRVAATLPATPSTADRVKRTLDRARADVTAAAVLLGMDPNAPDLDAKLQQLVDAAQAMTQSQTPVDYAPAAAAWANTLPGPDRDDTFADRLDAAAVIESTRPDADLLRVSDLQLCAKAARVTQDSYASTLAATRPAAIEARAQFPAAIASLQAEHAANRAPATTRPAADIQAIRDAASDARARMRRYAGDPDLLLSAADAITRQVAAAGSDRALLNASRPLPADPAPKVSQPDTSPQATPTESAAAVIREVQEMLAAMPADLSKLLQAVDASRVASQRADELRRGAATAPSDRQTAARRLADQAESARDGALATLTSAARPLTPTAVQSLSLRLQHVAPETATSAGAIDTRLSPALKRLQDAINSSDPGSLDIAANLTRQAIGQVQDDLRRAQSDLADRDPVAAAKWFARSPDLDRLSLSAPNTSPYPLTPRAAPARGPDPPGYGDALEAYFQALSKLAATPTPAAKTN